MYVTRHAAAFGSSEIRAAQATQRWICWHASRMLRAHGEGTSAATPHQIRRLWRPRRWSARPGRPFEAVVAHPTTQYASPTARGCLRCPDLGDSVRTATGARACANSLAVVLIHRIQPAGVAGAGLNGFRGPRCAPARRDEDGVESALCATVRSIQRSIQ